jgi:hypothetical protein
MNAKVGFLFLRQNLQNPPSRSSTLKCSVGERLSQDDVDNLFS